MKNYYELLEVSKAASAEEIKKAFKRLAKLYHPDAHPNDVALANKFKEINEAHSILGDGNKRRVYDQQLNNDGKSPGVQGLSDNATSVVNNILNAFDKFEF